MASETENAEIAWAEAADEADELREINATLVAALQEIADGCMSLRPGHVDYHKNRTKAQIEQIALDAIARFDA